MPRMVFSTGIANGEMVMAVPDTRIRLKILAPMMFPSERALWPLARAVIAVTSSGREVPRATIVRPMTEDGTPRASAISVPLSTRSFAPTAIRTAPIARRTMSFQIGFSVPVLSSAAASGAGERFIWITLMII